MRNCADGIQKYPVVSKRTTEKKSKRYDATSDEDIWLTSDHQPCYSPGSTSDKTPDKASYHFPDATTDGAFYCT